MGKDWATLGQVNFELQFSCPHTDWYGLTQRLRQQKRQTSTEKVPSAALPSTPAEKQVKSLPCSLGNHCANSQGTGVIFKASGKLMLLNYINLQNWGVFPQLSTREAKGIVWTFCSSSEGKRCALKGLGLWVQLLIPEQILGTIRDEFFP